MVTHEIQFFSGVIFVCLRSSDEEKLRRHCLVLIETKEEPCVGTHIRTKNQEMGLRVNANGHTFHFVDMNNLLKSLLSKSSLCKIPFCV